MNSQVQFQKHMDNIRRYSYLQGQNRKIAWLSEKYAEERFTQSLEREFVEDIDVHLEELANNLEPEDFKAMITYWAELAKNYWDADRRNEFFKKLGKLKQKYKNRKDDNSGPKSITDSFIEQLRAVSDGCDKILKHKAGRARRNGFARVMFGLLCLWGWYYAFAIMLGPLSKWSWYVWAAPVAVVFLILIGLKEILTGNISNL